MPRGDGTGPGGMGPMTGRAAGYCAGYGMPGYMNPYGGRMSGGFGWGRGRGRGYAQGYAQPAPFSGVPYNPFPYAAPYSKEQEKEALQNQLKVMEEQVGAMQERIEEIETEASKEKK